MRREFYRIQYKEKFETDEEWNWQDSQTFKDFSRRKEADEVLEKVREYHDKEYDYRLVKMTIEIEVM